MSHFDHPYQRPNNEMPERVGDIERQSWALRVKHLDEKIRTRQLAHQRSIADAQPIPDAQSVRDLPLASSEQQRENGFETDSSGTPNLAKVEALPRRRSPRPSTRPGRETMQLRCHTPDSTHTVNACAFGNGAASLNTSNTSNPPTPTTPKTSTRANHLQAVHPYLILGHEPASDTIIALIREVAGLTEDLRATKEAMQEMQAKTAALEDANAALLQTVANITEEHRATQLALKASTAKAHAAAQTNMTLNTVEDPNAEVFLQEEELAERIERLDADVRAIRDAVSAMERAVGSQDMTQQLKETLQRQQGMGKEITRLWSPVDGLDQEFLVEVQTLKAVVPRLACAQSMAQVALSTLERRISALEDKAPAEAAAENLTEQLPELPPQDHGIREALEGLGTRIENLENAQVGQARPVQPEAGVLKTECLPARVGRVSKQARPTREDLLGDDPRIQEVNLLFESLQKLGGGIQQIEESRPDHRRHAV